MAAVVNDYSDTLAAPLAIDGTTVTVTTGAPAAAVGQELRVRIGREIVRVTVDTATSWTVLERAAEDAARFPAAAHDAGTRVLAPWTVAGLVEQIVANSPPFDSAAFLAAAHTWGDDQTVTGTVTAAAFVGDGSGLTGLPTGFDEPTFLAAAHTWTGAQTFVGDLTVRQSGGTADVDDLHLGHDGTRAFIHSHSGGVAFLNAAGTSDSLHIADDGVFTTAAKFRNSTTSGTTEPWLEVESQASATGLVARFKRTGESSLDFKFLNSTDTFLVASGGLNLCFDGATTNRIAWATTGKVLLFPGGGTLDLANAPAGIGLGSGTGGRTVYGLGWSTTTEGVPLWSLTPVVVDNTHATRAYGVTLSAYSTSAAQEGVRVEANAAGVRLSFFGEPAAARPVLSYSRAGESTAAAALRAALDSLGLVDDQTTA